MKVVKIKIDNNNPTIIAYQEAFKKGYNSLSEEQRALFDENAKKTNIKSKAIKDQLNKKDLISIIRKFWYGLIKPA